MGDVATEAEAVRAPVVGMDKEKRYIHAMKRFVYLHGTVQNKSESLSASISMHSLLIYLCCFGATRMSLIIGSSSSIRGAWSIDVFSPQSHSDLLVHNSFILQLLS